jgi:F-type H+-transporting ATPase subunit b
MLNTFLTQFAASENHAEEASGFAALGFDPKAFIIQLITFLLVFYILRRFAFGKIVELLERRRQTIEEGVRLTAKMSEEKEKLDKEVAQKLAEARRQADEIIAASHEQAKTMVKDAETAAETKAATILAEAKKKIDEETARARRKLEHEMVSLVAEATEVIVEEKLDPKKDAALLTKALRSQG